MSAGVLREAAARLREAAEAATPGPWECYGDHLVWPSGKGPAANDPIAGISEAHEECAAYIALMSPPVAIALADWLDSAADRHEVVEHPAVGVKCCLTCDLDLENPDDGPHCEDMDRALTTARAVLGTTP